MKSKQWKARLKKQMLEVGTYRSAFDVALQSAADVLEKRDAALREFVDSGGDAYESQTLVKSLTRIADALERLAGEAERSNDAREEMEMERLVSELDRL